MIPNDTINTFVVANGMLRAEMNNYPFVRFWINLSV